MQIFRITIIGILNTTIQMCKILKALPELISKTLENIMSSCEEIIKFLEAWGKQG